LRKLVGAKWRVVAVVAVGLMTWGTLVDGSVLRGWAMLAGLLAACLWVRSEREAEYERQAIERDLAEWRYQEYLKKWAHQPFESGWNACEAAMQVKQSRN
jgi:hypothetical protein